MKPLLPLNCLHVYYGFASDFSVSSLLSALSDEEKIRASRFKRTQDQHLFIAARANLRRILASYLNVETNHIHFEYNLKGKPFVKDSIDVQFSTAHSGDIFLLGFTRNHSIGIDIEHLDRVIAKEELSAFLFSERELQKFQYAERNLHQEHFINCWTRKEAVLKARGTGLSFPLQNLEVSFLKDEKPEVIATRWAEREKSEWFMESLDLPGNYRGAVAVHGKIESMEINTLKNNYGFHS